MEELTAKQPLDSADVAMAGEGEEPSAEESQPRGTANVRSRVRYWITDIVDEMRKKSPASVQKWVDSIQIPNSSEAGSASATVDGVGDDVTSSVADVMPPASQEYEHHVSSTADQGSDTEDTDVSEGHQLRTEDAASGMAEAEIDQLTAGPSTSPTSTSTPVRGEEQKPEGSSISLKSFLSKKSLLEKFSRSNTNLEQSQEQQEPDERPPPDDDGRKGLPSLTAMGKSKINEIYDKLGMTKAKYSLIKAKKLDIRNMLSASRENLKKVQPEAQKVDVAMDETVAEVSGGLEDSHMPERPDESEQRQQHLVDDGQPYDTYEFSFEDSFPKGDEIPGVISEEDEEKENLELPPYTYDPYLNPQKPYRMGIGKIGRSSSENPRATGRRYNLMEIGRSFSEMNDDDTFAIDECNNSCPNPSSLNTSSSINNSSNILTRSVPVSPIPRTASKISIQQDHSYSESPRRRSTMVIKDSSLQSDSSRCSSVESLLNARKPDPEKILLNLGFGPAPHSTDVLSKIPKRFLKPSQVRGVDTEAFLRQQQLSMHIHENSVLGYRGLVGNPHIPPSTIVAKIMERFQENEKSRLSVSVAQNDSRNSSGPPSPVPIPRHSSIAN